MSIAAQLAEAIRAGEPWPPFGTPLELDRAYRIQHDVTRLRSSDPAGGVKAGVTAKPIQGFLGIDHALIGSLYGDTRREPGAAIAFLEGRIVECEVAVRVDAHGNPTAIAPAIEFVRLCFASPQDMSAGNLVATNMGTESYILGEFQPWDEELGSLPVELSRNGETINQTGTGEALGGPAEAVRWMWTEARERGHALAEGTVFLTGACGATPPAERGSYTADFNKLGSIRFTIE